MRMLHPERDEALELSLNDVFIVPGRFEGGSRLEVDLRPPDGIGGSQPIVSANMNAVTGKRMAETLARYGGLGVLPQDMDVATVARITRHLHTADPRYDTALTVRPGATLRDVMGLIRKRAHDLVVVVDRDSRPLGIVTQADLRGRDQYTPVERVMSRDPVTVRAGSSNREAYERLETARVKSAPVVDRDGRLVGVLTRRDAVRLELLAPSTNAQGQLLVAAAIGISSRAAETAAALLEAGVDVFVLDTAHGHQRRMLEAIGAVRAVIGPDRPLVAGNVCTAEGTRDLLEAGADVVKVNVAPGAMCTTRMQTGVGRPTFSAVRACAAEARRRGRHVWADGGVRHPRDVALYLAAGAARVMIGSLFAGTYESPGDIKEDRDGRLYKESYGMASARAVSDRTAELDAFERARRALFREGISSSKVYLRPGFESAGELVLDMISGVQSAFTYVGATDIESFHERAVIGVQTPAGYHEGKPVQRLG
ncbi:MAG: GuaB1 family IMP dehydrogenase-related protein [Planctomycetota bacterium]|nr:MAG: GuaB1 family IMP dehydrogenase-related protein [Planctomycetota bacterium]